MPRVISDEELQLRKRARRRLIGAIAVVIGVAVFLPMVLDSQPKQVAQDITVSIPDKEQTGTFNSKVVPVSETAAQPAAVPAALLTPPAAEPARVAPQPEESEKKTTSAVSPDTKIAQPVPPAEEKPRAGASAKLENKTPARSGSEVKSEKPATDGYVVQLGAFSKPINAKQLQEKLSANGFKSYTEVLKTDKGEKTRVRAGPFPSREAAEKANDKLKKMGLNGIVAPK